MMFTIYDVVSGIVFIVETGLDPLRVHLQSRQIASLGVKETANLINMWHQQPKPSPIPQHTQSSGESSLRACMNPISVGHSWNLHCSVWVSIGKVVPPQAWHRYSMVQCSL